MTDYRLTQIAWYQDTFQTNSNAILTYIDDNPGCTRAEVASGTGINAEIVKVVVKVLDEIHLITFGYDDAGLEYIWTAEDWAYLIKTNIGDARDWVNANNNGLVSDMATALSIHFAIAATLGWALQNEGTSKITAL